MPLQHSPEGIRDGQLNAARRRPRKPVGSSHFTPRVRHDLQQCDLLARVRFGCKLLSTRAIGQDTAMGERLGAMLRQSRTPSGAPGEPML